MMPYPPLGTLYAASLLRQKGYSVAIFDSMLAENESEIQAALESYKPRMVVIYDDDFNYLTKMCLSRMRIAAFGLARFAKQTGAVVAVHGSDANDHVADYLLHDADYVLSGEADITLGELADYIFGKPYRRLDEIHGIAYRDPNLPESIQTTVKRDVLRNLDELPWPAWDLVDIDRYRKIWKHRHGYFSLNMVTTRGCPFHCNWCAKPIYGQVYHARSPENVVAEIQYMRERIRPDHIWFCDDIFGLKPGWIAHFAEVVRKEKAIIPFKCLARVDLLLKENTIQDLANSGCNIVWVGAESGSQKILDAMEKGTTVEQIYKASHVLRQHGIRVGFFLQYGYPGETEEDIDLTLQMVKDCKPDEIGISVSYPLPGTKFYESVKRQLGEKKNWFDSQDLELMFPSEYVPDFYRALHKITHKKFRIWQGIDILKEITNHPQALNRSTLRRIAAAAYHALTLPPLKAQLNFLAAQQNSSKRETNFTRSV